MAVAQEQEILIAASPAPNFFYKINHAWHKPALQFFMAIVLAHWAEHLVQAAQIYILGWPVPDSRGLLGQFFPWLVKSEALHYGYALVMLVGLWTLRRGFQGLSYKWWMISFGIQFWHHIEHLLLIIQATLGRNFFGSPVPTSILQLIFPRVELHLFYNTIVFIPMAIAMYYHMFPPLHEPVNHGCACSWRRESADACPV
jgi:hypothetical protein